MRKLFLVFFSLLVLHLCNGQGFSKAEYFFDTDPGVNNGTSIALSGTSDTINFTAPISTSSLAAGFHFLGLRVKHSSGTWGLFETRGFYISNSAVDAANISAAEYFFDTDPGAGNGTATSVGTTGGVVNFIATIPVSLSAGFHFLAIRTKGVDGIWGLFETRGFYISNSGVDAANISAAEYYFDTDPGVGNGTSLSVGATGGVVNFTAAIPTALSTGFHFLAIRTKGVDGKWGLFESRGFYISGSAVDAANITAAEYFFDTDPGVGNGISTSVGSSGGVVNFTAVIPTSLTPGFHFLSIRTKGVDGVWGLFEQRGFYISTAANDMPIITAAEYFYDTDPGVGNGQSLTITTPGSIVIQTFNVPVPGTMSNGQHFLGLRVKDQGGNWSLFDYDTLNIGTSTISCPSNATVTTAAGQCTAVVNNLDPTISPIQSYNYLLSGATTGSGSGSVSGFTFNAGVTTVTYTLASSPTCSFTVTVNATPPNITSQPSSQSVCTGSNVTFSVTATGSGLTYQWRKNTVNIPGANSSSYTITGAAAGDAGNYDVIVATGCSTSTTSTIATLTVGAGASITTQPSSQIVCPAANVTFTVVATGSGLTYQWRKNTVNISGANSTSYTINNVSSTDAAGYDVVITGGCGTITSNTALLTVNTTTVINVQPSSQAVCTGNNANFSVTAAGTSLTYQWRKNSTNIPGANSSTYTITGVVATDAANYDVVVSGACGVVTSGIAVLTVNPLTSITTQPVSQTVCGGTNVTFTVAAAGTSLTYQWRKNSTNISGATSSSYTINNVSGTDAANYDVVVTGACGVATSNAASLVVNPATAINTQPLSQTICSGSNASLSVTASGTSLTYQWRKNGSNISGATSSTYSITGTITTDAGNYDVVVTGNCGIVTSSVAVLTVNAITNITTQPTTQSACSGSSVTFTVVANGSSLTYQWRKNSSNIAGATSSSYTIASATLTDAGSYDVIVTGACGTVTSTSATLTINAATAISNQPTSQTVCTGSNVSFSVTASGTAINYQWRKNTVNIPGANSSTYSLNGVGLSDAGNYDVVVTGICGTNTSTVAILTVNTNAAISTQPTTQSVCAGSNVTLTVVATGTSLSYQWRKNTVNIPGATSASYTITNVSSADAANYDVVVTSASCTPSAVSSIATITVNPLPSFTIGNVPSTMCKSDSAITLTASVSGGIWTGTGVSGNKFDPAVAGTGTFSISYSLINSFGCTKTVSTSITVNECAERHRSLDDKSAIIVYPVPNGGQFKIKVNSDLYKKLSMKVYSSDGKYVNTQEFPGLTYGSVLSVDLRKLQDGVYHLYIYGENGDHRAVSIVIAR